MPLNFLAIKTEIKNICDYFNWFLWYLLRLCGRLSGHQSTASIEEQA